MPVEINLNPLSRNISIDPRTRSFIRAKPAKATDSKPSYYERSYTDTTSTSSRKSGNKKGVHFAIDVPDKRDGEQWVLTPHPDYTPYWYQDDDRKTPKPAKPSPALYQLNRNSQPAYGRPLSRLTYPAQLQRRQSNPHTLGLPGLSSQSYPPYERGRAPISSYGSTIRTRSASGTDSTRYASLSRRTYPSTTTTEIHQRSRSRSRPRAHQQSRSRSRPRAHPPANTTIKHTYIIQNRPREPRTRTRSRERTRPVTRYYDEEDRVPTPLTAFREGPRGRGRRRRDSYYV